jgi:hypothetical protein
MRQFLSPIELPHPHRVLERRSRGTDARMVHASADRVHGEIELRRVPAVEAQFLLAELSPPLERRVVEEVKAQRLLDLVGELAGEQHP